MDIEFHLVYNESSFSCGERDGEYMVKIGICDDQPHIVEKIENQVTNIMMERDVQYEIVTFTDGEVFGQSALASYDIITLDVEIKEVSGLDFYFISMLCLLF